VTATTTTIPNLINRRTARPRGRVDQELLVDNFAGAGGASLGIEAALGRAVDIAINHDATALEIHQINHPDTDHLVTDVWDVDPVAACRGRPVGLAWFSPDCTHFSLARGGKPRKKSIRSLAWVVTKWARAVRPRLIILENVREFLTWGPLGRDSKPVAARAGETFRRWKGQLERLGYTVEHRLLTAADYGTPTIRKRLFVVARCDGQPIRWPASTHAPRAKAKFLGLKPWRSAAECVDWSIPCPSIFERKRPLAAWGDKWGWNLIDGGVVVERLKEATPRPWKVFGTAETGFRISDEYGMAPIAQIPPNYARTEANTALITLAVNNHEALVSVCRKISAEAGGRVTLTPKLVRELRAALAAVDKQE